MRSHLPLLNSAEIAAPCPMSWANMNGGDTQRYCDACKLHVHDLSSMTAQEAETLLQTHQGELCVRYTQNREGRIITDELPARLRPLRALVFKQGAMAGVAFALLILIAGMQQASAQTKAQPGPAKTKIKSGKTKPTTVKPTDKKQEATKTQSKSATGGGNTAANAKTTANKSEPAAAPTRSTLRSLGISTSLGRYTGGVGVPLSQKDEEKHDKLMLETLQRLQKKGLLRDDLERALDRTEQAPNTPSKK